jgi:hypothetical protein
MAVRLWLQPAIVVVLAANLLDCSSSSDAGASLLAGPCYGPGCSAGGASGGLGGAASGVIQPPDSGTVTSTWSSLCGPEPAGCLPELDAGGCADLIRPQSSAPQNDASADASDGAIGFDSSALTCRIRSVSGPIVRVCELAGSGRAGAPCTMPTDCAVGLTCVAEGSVGLCRQYCCADPESCPSNTYCTTRSTVVSRDVDKGTWTFGSDVPVCTAAENCPLSDPYPCPEGQNCTCPATKACMIVRRQGLTACVKPGTGTQGQFCPCAAGFACSNTTFTCLKLCQLTSNVSSQAAASQCAAGNTCQASNDVPADWGVCNDVPLLVN